MSTKQKAIYPIFLDCCRYTTDEFWREIFENLAHGKTTKFCYIANHVIHASNKRKNFSYTIPRKIDPDNIEPTPEYVFHELRKLLMTHTSLASVLDVRNKKTRKKDNLQEITTWAQIKKKNIRDIFIVQFVVRMRDEFKLDWIASNNLYTMIHLAFLFKLQNTKDVVFDEGKIESINGIDYDPETSQFVNRYTQDDKCSAETNSDTQNYIRYYWDKYAKTMNKPS
jgi:hypothetical protein